MTLTPSDLRELLAEVRERQIEEPSEYRAGYIDAIKYVIDWFEEDE